MIEAERIIEKGIIPKDFLKEEIKDEFLITENRKRIWTVELDLLFEVIRICNKYKIQYTLAGGNILGAVRHKGFIPWDDDIDVAMLRNDYEKFCNICSAELKPPYFFQTTMTEKNCWFNTARVCNSNTTGIRKPLMGVKDVNKGIFIDILPMDAISNNGLMRKIIFARVKMRTVIANIYSFDLRNNLFIRITKTLLHMTRFDVKKWYIKTNKIASSVNLETAKKIGFVMWTPYKHDRVMWDKADFNSVVELPFEFTSIQVPTGYKDILETMYNDYMQLPPKEERGKWHSIIFDPDTPYEEYCLLHNC